MLLNLTPHKIVILGGPAPVEISPSGKVARVGATFQDAGIMEKGVATFRRTFGAVEGLPDPVKGVTLIVSALVAQAAPRADVLSPGELVRGPDGQPIGCRGLIRSI